MAQQLFGISGHEGWVIVGLDGSVYVEVEVGYSRATADHIKAVLWHEAMHVKYAFERRWPTAWPFRSQSDPTGVLQALLHFSLDGWLDRHGKPKICSKADRMRELRDQLELHGSALGEKTVNPIAEDLWQRDTDVCDVWRIMKSLGLEVEAGATWGQYLLSASE